MLGLLDDASEHAREAVALARERGLSNLLANLPSLAGILIERGDVGDARKALVEAAAPFSRRAGWSRMGVIARRFICLADREGRIGGRCPLARLPPAAQRPSRSTSPNQQKHMQSLGEAMTGAALAPDELARRTAEGPMLDEAAVCAHSRTLETLGRERWRVSRALLCWPLQAAYRGVRRAESLWRRANASRHNHAGANRRWHP